MRIGESKKTAIDCRLKGERVKRRKGEKGKWGKGEEGYRLEAAGEDRQGEKTAMRDRDRDGRRSRRQKAERGAEKSGLQVSDLSEKVVSRAASPGCHSEAGGRRISYSARSFAALRMTGVERLSLAALRCDLSLSVISNPDFYTFLCRYLPSLSWLSLPRDRQWRGSAFLAWRFARVFPRFRHDRTVPIARVEYQSRVVERRWNFGGISVEFGARRRYRASTALRSTAGLPKALRRRICRTRKRCSTPSPELLAYVLPCSLLREGEGCFRASRRTIEWPPEKGHV
jgi:hypothetical protein